MISNNIEMQTEKIYNLYSVPKFTDTNQALTQPEHFNLNALIEELTKFDNDYYFRVHPKTQYTFFSDVDGIDDFDEYITQFINFMA